jgi:hypothetical protein
VDQADADGGNWRVDFADAVADGTRLVVTQTDVNGNTSELSNQVVVDATPPPAPVITSGPGGPTNDATPAFEFTQEPETGYFCRIDDGPEEDCTSAGVFTAPELPDGEYTFTVAAQDVAENRTESSRTFTVDTSAPSAPAIAGPNGLTRDRTPSFSLTSAEATGFECAIDGASLAPCGAEFTAPSLGDGTHAMRAVAVDAAGNRSGESNRAFSVDTVAPETEFTKTPKNPSTKRKAKFAWAASEAAEFTCKLDKAAAASCGSKMKLKRLKPGKHVFSVSATDAAGNAEAKPAKFKFRVLE